MPGTDPHKSAEILIGESMDGHVHLPVLPARGLGADAIARTGALMADMSLDCGPRSWRVVDNPSHFSKVAADFLQRDLDACEEVWGSTPEKVRLVALGPWTFASTVELVSGHLMAADFGAVRYCSEALAAGLLAQAADIRRRIGCDIDVIIQEPLLSEVARGTIKAPSTLMGKDGFLPAQGYREISEIFRAVTEPLAAADSFDNSSSGQGIRATIALGTTESIKVAALMESGAHSFWLRSTALQSTEEKDFAVALIDAGMSLELGIVPTRVSEREEHTNAPVPTDSRDIAQQVAVIWDELGFSRTELIDHLNLSTAGGFVGSSEAEAIAQLGAGRKAAELINRAAGDLARG